MMQVHLSCQHLPRVTDGDNPHQLRTLLFSLENAVRAVSAAQNAFSPINKLPPEIIVSISEFVVESRTWKSMFDLVKMTHVCRCWRTTLILFPHLWSAVLVKNDRKEFVAACLERSQRVPLTVRLDMEYGNNCNSCKSHGCTCLWWVSIMQVTKRKPCDCHTAILPLLNDHHTKRIRELDICLTIDNYSEGFENDIFRAALDDLKFRPFSLPSLESLSFNVYPDFDYNDDPSMRFPADMFGWDTSPPANLRHLTLHGCYGGPIPSLRNVTSFELAGVSELNPMEINPRTFFQFISGNPSLVSLTLAQCSFPDRSMLPWVVPVELSQLKTLQLTNIQESPSLPCFMEIPSLRTLSSLHISASRTPGYDHHYFPDFRVCARNDDGFQLSFDFPELFDEEFVEDKLTPDWVGITRIADPRPTFVRLERQGFDREEDRELKVSPLPLFTNAEVLEINASFADCWYPHFWDDLKKIGPQLTTLRLEVAEGMDMEMFADSVKGFVKARLEKGMPLTRLERMKFEWMDEEEERKSERLWKEFRASLDIDQYIATQ